MLGERFQGIHGCLSHVRSCSFSSALVHLSSFARLVAAVRLSARSPSRLSRRRGGAAAGGCLLVRARWGCGAGVSSISFLFRPVFASRLFATRSGEAVMSGVPSCLLGCRC